MTYRFANPAAQAHGQQLLIRHMLESAVTAAPDQEIVYRGSVRHSYAELERRVHRLANLLKSLSVEPGATVAVMDWDSHRYLEAYFAVPMMGAVLQTVNIRLTEDQIAYCMESAGASILLFHRDFTPLVEALSARLPHVRAKVVIDDGGPHDAGGVAGEYEALLSLSGSHYPFEDFDENALATTFHTTGTTGLPKAVQFSHRQLVLHSLSLMAALATQPSGQGFRRSDVYMPLTPMFHVHAWGLPFVATLTGTKQVYPGRYEPALILQLQQSEQVSFSHCVPTVLQMLLDAAADRGPGALTPWTMLIGGAALSASLQEAAEKCGITVLAGYGMSETGPVISLARSEAGSGRGGNEALRPAGRPIPLVQTAIADENLNMQPWDGAAQGELVLRSPWLTRGYDGDRQASDALWRGGWLHTQDIATIGPDGTITIRDRLKDVIKTGGEWVSSIEVENFIHHHEAILEAAVIGVPDTKWTERPFAFIVLKEGAASFTAEALRQHLVPFVTRGLLSRIAIPDGIRVITSLPRTSVGKIDKKALRAMSATTADDATAAQA